MKYQPLGSQSFLSVGGCYRADVNWVSPTSFSQSVPIPESGLSSALRPCWESIHLSGARRDSLQPPARPPLNLSTLGLASTSHCSCPSRTSLLPASCQSVLHQQEERALKKGRLVLVPELTIMQFLPIALRRKPELPGWLQNFPCSLLFTLPAAALSTHMPYLTAHYGPTKPLCLWALLELLHCLVRPPAPSQLGCHPLSTPFLTSPPGAGGTQLGFPQAPGLPRWLPCHTVVPSFLSLTSLRALKARSLIPRHIPPARRRPGTQQVLSTCSATN